MKSYTAIVAAGILSASFLSRAEVTVITGHNANADAKPSFAFTNVPPASAKDAATGAKFTIVDGEQDPNGGDVSKLNDGKLPTEEDQPEENFFFNAGTSGGRLQVDLGRAMRVKQVNTYSWHPNTRGPQVYKLYASDGAATNFNAAPKNGTNPETCGWKFIAKVNTKAKDESDDGGQYGVSISDSSGALGQFRYLLFDMSRTEENDDFGNTFYSEIDVIDADANAGAENSAAPSAPAVFVFKTADEQCAITVNTAAAPDLTDWADHQLAPALAEWYPKIVALLPSDGYTAPAHFTITIKPMDGVAFTSDSGVTANSDWLKQEIGREAIGSLVHEAVHVVQRFNGRNPGWLVEGSADYIRWFRYEPQSHGADIVWMRHLRNFSPRYDASYRVTADFLNYVTEKYDKDLVTQLNAAMRQNKYDENLWKEFTGKTVQELGAEWKQDVEMQLAQSSVNGVTSDK
jgi:hypothetical protein